MSLDSVTIEDKGAGKREKTKANNRQAILDAAREVFSELGYGETTVRDIIRRTGLASGTFYNYYRSKEEVFEALNDHSALELRPHLIEVRRSAKTFEEFIEQTFAVYFEYVAQHRANFALARRNAGHLRIRMDSPQVIAGFDELRADLVRAVESGLAPDVDIDYLTSALVGTAFEMADVMIGRENEDPRKAAEFASALVLSGVRSIKTKSNE